MFSVARFQGYKFLLFIMMFGMVVLMASDRPYIELDTKNSWFDHYQKKIAWVTYQTATCVLPLNTTLNLIDCGSNGQLLKSVSSNMNSISIESTDFNSSTHFYSINAKDSVGDSCGELVYLVHIPPLVRTEIKKFLEGGSVCLSIESNPALYAFWPQQTGSPTNCHCPIVQISTIISFSDCSCIRLQETNFIVTFNATTDEICWQNLTLAANGSAVGIVKQENLNNCGDYTYSTALTYKKMVVMFVEELSQFSSANIVNTTVLPSPTVMSTQVTQPTKKDIPITSSNLIFTTEISTIKVTLIQVTEVSTRTDNNMIVLLSAGISSVGTIFITAAAIIILATILVRKAKTKKNVTSSNADPVYESPRLSMAVPEPIYEDITLPPNATTTETVVHTEPNEAYSMRKIPQHIGMEDNESYAVKNMTATAHNIGMDNNPVRNISQDNGMEDNEAYSVRNTMASAQNIGMENNEAYALTLRRKIITKNVQVHNITMEENEAYHQIVEQK